MARQPPTMKLLKRKLSGVQTSANTQAGVKKRATIRTKTLKGTRKENPQSVVQHPPILRLPGEIRNLIYEEAIGINSTELNPRITMGYRSWRTGKKFRARGLRDCFSLAQTCQQLRSEFRPIYYENTRFSIPVREIHRFSTYLRVSGLPSPRRLRVTIGGISIKSVDYLPLLNFQSRHPDCDIDFDHALGPLEPWVHLKGMKSPEWQALLKKKALSQVIVFGSQDQIRLRTIFRVEYAPDWMRETLMRSPLAKELIESLGLPSTASFGVFYG